LAGDAPPARQRRQKTRPRIYTAHARTRIRAAADLTAWLDRHGRSLQQCRQADIDHWLTIGPSASQVRDFLTWAAARGHCPVLHDDTLDLIDRAAGCLLLLYGQAAGPRLLDLAGLERQHRAAGVHAHPPHVQVTTTLKPCIGPTKFVTWTISAADGRPSTAAALDHLASG
jgi:hypothetical protein